MDPQKFRKIKVVVNRPGMVLYTREGYYLQRGPGRVNPTNPSKRLMADLYSADSSTMVYDGVPLTLLTDPNDPDVFKIRVDAKGLAWSYATETEPRKAEVILVVTTFDKKGKQLTAKGLTMGVKAPPDVPPTGRLERNVMLEYKVPHDPKAVRARFVVRVTASGRIGTVDAGLNGVPLPAGLAAPAPPAAVPTAAPAPANP